uniref:SRCR domain-containing protein n=1 Tax=Myripristis murdjan TaxID=586833 RepID=A0A668A600_9TELE
GSVRLVNGNSVCSGRAEVKSDQSWSSVCEADFDQQDAQVVCRELGCGPPSVLQGALYGEGEAPMGTKEFQCEGSESSLLDCGSSGSARNTCSPGKAVGLTCSGRRGPVRLVGGASRCNGTLEMKRLGEWRPVGVQSELNLKTAAAMCRELDCGSAVSAERRRGSLYRSKCSTNDQNPSRDQNHRHTAINFLPFDTVTVDKGDNLSPESVRLVNGNSLCSGRVEVKSDQSWSSVCEADFDQQDAEVLCRELGCGPPSVLQGALYGEAEAPMWTREFQCEGNESSLLDCGSSGSARNTCSPGKAVGLTCSEPDDVRLVGGASRCAGRLEMKHLGVWRPVDELDFDLNLKSATAVCRQLGCGSAVSAERRQDPLHEYKWYLSSSCFLSGFTLRECVYSPDNLAITCSESDDVRLAGGASRCTGGLEVKQNGHWLPADEWNSEWSLKTAAAVCRLLDCGSVVSTEERKDPSDQLVYQITSDPICMQSLSNMRECSSSLSKPSRTSVQINCSGNDIIYRHTTMSLNLLYMPGSGKGSGVKSDQSWSSVCEADFDQQDAEVVCRELGCGAPSVLQGALYGEVEAPMWTKEFQCKGSESSLLDCGSSGSARNTCSPGKAVGLTCSEPHDIRLVGGASRCNGTLEVKHLGDWKPVDVSHVQWNLKTAGAVCRELDCGSAVSAVRRQESVFSCFQAAQLSFRRPAPPCGNSRVHLSSMGVLSWCPNMVFSLSPESVRLVNGNSLCSGRVEVKSDQSWSSVCEADFDQQDAEVVCRELGCGPPSVLQGALYGEAEAPMWTKEYQCEGNESSLLDCGSSGSARNTCSPGKAVGLTCSEPDVVRLVGEASRCSGRLEVKHLGEWEPVLFTGLEQSMQEAAAVCRDLNCGGVVSAKQASEMLYIPVSEVRLSCLQSGSRLRECIEIRTAAAYARLEITCSGNIVNDYVYMCKIFWLLPLL